MSPHDFYIFQINKKVIKSAIERYIVYVCDPKRDLISISWCLLVPNTHQRIDVHRWLNLLIFAVSWKRPLNHMSSNFITYLS